MTEISATKAIPIVENFETSQEVEQVKQNVKQFLSNKIGTFDRHGGFNP